MTMPDEVKAALAASLIVGKSNKKRVQEIGEAFIDLTKKDHQGDVLMAGVALLGGALSTVPDGIREHMIEAVCNMLRSGSEFAAGSDTAKRVHQKLKDEYEKQMGHKWDDVATEEAKL